MLSMTTEWVKGKLIDNLNSGRRGVNGRARYAEFWNALRANPGRWAKYPGTGRLNSNYKPGFEVVHRGHDTFVRFVSE